MNIETLLYPLHDNHLRDYLTPVSQLCRQENKHLTTLIFGESLPVPPMVAGGTEAAEIWAQRIADVDARLQTRARDTDKRLQQEGVSYDIRTNLGDGLLIDDVIGLQARYADLVLMQRHGNTRDEAAFVKRLCHGVLFQSGRPLLLYSDTPPKSLKFKSILIAWDGKLAASRALSAAFSLLKTADSVHVVCINSENQLAANTTDAGWDLSAYLARHQLNITLHKRDRAGQSISTVIQAQADEVEADLIVMGAYGRSRLKERLFGGTTVEMLNQSGVPLLMAH